MKHVIFLLLSLLLLVFAPLEAQTLRNANNATIGKVESDGTIRNANNATIGKAEGVDRKIAAVLFFMHLLQ